MLGTLSRLKHFCAAFIVAILAIQPPLLSAQSAQLFPQPEDGAASYSWRIGAGMDNDFLFGFTAARSSDHEYTHGTFVFLERAGGMGVCGGRTLRFTMAQRIYTPRVEDDAGRVPGQRAHAGWLHSEISCSAGSDPWGLQATLLMGVVGPAAKGEQAQRLTHRIMGFRTPKGWQGQVPNRPEFGGAISKGFASPLVVSNLSAWMSVGIAASTIRVGGHWQVGISKPPTSVTRVTLAGTLSASAEYVGYDYLLAGVGLRGLRGVLRARGVMGMGSVDFTYGFTVRTKAYEEEFGGHVYGTVSLSRRF